MLQPHSRTENSEDHIGFIVWDQGPVDLLETYSIQSVCFHILTLFWKSYIYTINLTIKFCYIKKKHLTTFQLWQDVWEMWRLFTRWTSSSAVSQADKPPNLFLTEMMVTPQALKEKQKMLVESPVTYTVNWYALYLYFALEPLLGWVHFFLCTKTFSVSTVAIEHQ